MGSGRGNFVGRVFWVWLEQGVGFVWVLIASGDCEGGWVGRARSAKEGLRQPCTCSTIALSIVCGELAGAAIALTIFILSQDTEVHSTCHPPSTYTDYLECPHDTQVMIYLEKEIESSLVQ